MDTYLETERLLLRRFTADDAPLLIELDSDPEVMRYINGGGPADERRIRERTLPQALQDYEQGERWGMWAVLVKPRLEFAGWFHLWPNPDFPEYDAEVGYRFKRAFWGRGLATEGTRALIDKALCEFGCTSVFARTLIGNAASRRVMEKSGLRYVRDFEETKFHGAPAVIYATVT